MTEFVILKKCIYGTVQYACQWNKKSGETLQEFHFTANLVEPCLMSGIYERGTVTLCMYVCMYVCIYVC